MEGFMEIIDYYDEKNSEKLGSADRKYVHDNDLWHREIAVWVMNKNKEILLQRRSHKKKNGANKLSIVAGHVEKDEKEIIAAIRELSEEVGLNYEENQLIFLGVYKLEQDKNKCFSYTYLVITDKNINEMIMQEDEVSELKYITLKELEKKIEIQDEELPLVKRSYIKELVEKIKGEANKI